MKKPPTIRGVDFTIGELNQTERELVEAIEKRCDDPRIILRLTRILSNKFSYCRSVVSGQNYLERNNLITVNRSKR
jgi:hypothetical protein